MIRITLAAALLAAALAPDPLKPKSGDTFTGKVSRVHDGDTFWLELPTVTHRIRIHGADAPETQRKGFWPTQPGAVEARDWLVKQIDGKEVKVTVRSRSYDRYVCKVELGARDIGLELIERGLAHADPRYATKAQRDAETRAREAKRGVWSGANVTPRAWRAGKR